MSIFTNYLKDLFNGTLNIILVILDLTGIVAVFVLVVDDLVEFLIVLAFIIILHIGPYLIYHKQAIRISQFESMGENESVAIRTMLRLEIQQNIDILGQVWEQIERSRQTHIKEGHQKGGILDKGLARDFLKVSKLQWQKKAWTPPSTRATSKE